MAEDQVVTCSECGGKNRIPATALARGSRARCGYCDAPLPVYGEGADVALLRPAVIEHGSRNRPRRGRWLFGFLTGVIVAAVALYFLDRRVDLQAIEIGGTPLAEIVDSSWDRLIAFLDPDGEVVQPDAEPGAAPAEEDSAAEADPAPDTASEAPAEPPLTAVEAEEVTVSIPAPEDPAPPATPTLPGEPSQSPSTAAADVPEAPGLVPETISPGIVFNETGREGVAPLNIVTPDGRDFFVKLVDSTTGEDAVGLYVRGGSTGEFNVPLGAYEIRYASGATWYGLDDLFGPETDYAEANRTFDFREEDDQYAGYTLTLIMQEGGNLDTRPIGGSAF